MPIEGITLTDVCINGAKVGARCINANGVILNGVSIEAAQGPALSVDTARDVQIYRFSGKPQGDEPAIRFQQVETGVVESCATTGEVTLLELAEAGNRDIRLIDNRTANKAQEVKFMKGASESAVVMRN